MKPKEQPRPQRVVYRPSSNSSTNHNLEITRNNVQVMHALNRLKTNVARAQDLIDGNTSSSSSTTSLQRSAQNNIDRRKMFAREGSDDSITVTVWPAAENHSTTSRNRNGDDDLFVLRGMRASSETSVKQRSSNTYSYDQQLRSSATSSCNSSSRSFSSSSSGNSSNKKASSGRGGSGSAKRLVQRYDLRSSEGMDLLQRLDRHISK
uniref:Uncharacterized protein n=1 Tax=Leptocylindrus danicus TaxID=163516 RepID=A0A6U2RDU1_9STRA|eukprot:CAMPEP_0116031028 /NCGR_PEP_ID=MMETSP0321-20121206/17249_1 /TAXON_ID=163516 /ORGANISM="Leptocylindrus danicus var. danicus, Strain B650" /LENGTH=206 /DNA_ID=CAMNT_0003506033 /DNA_START=35 /DNA_END=655 /DNA_ORIENTATION=-